MYRPPDAPPAPAEAIDCLALLMRGRDTAVLTGAGCSTESGIPDYRGPRTRERERLRRPIQHLEFVRSPQVRARYWARSLLGWRSFADPRPNAAHRALAELEAARIVSGLITQNVDRLHHRAGSARVIELHGALERVRCLDCGSAVARAELQERLRGLNPGFLEAYLPEIRPDGDAEVPPEAERAFNVPDCAECGGVLKPDVVFFGANVPRPIVAEAEAAVDSAEALLVVGSSLAVYSGYRFVARAAERRIPIGIVNLGETRGDPLATAKVEGLAGDVLPRLASALGVPCKPSGPTGASAVA
jgi:NAD+-dependent protein deacetylase sirtuin 4